MTVINGLPISQVLVKALESRIHIDDDADSTEFQIAAEQIVEITYTLIELMDMDSSIGDIGKIHGFLINLGYMREMMNDLHFAILEGYKEKSEMKGDKK